MVKVLLFTDIGGDIDDILALYCLLSFSNDLDLMGIVVSGGAHAKRAFLCRELLKKLNINHIPVIEPLDGDLFESSHEFSMPEEFEKEWQSFTSITMSTNSADSSQFIINAVNENFGNIVVLAIGPLTALANAIQVDSHFTKGISKFYIQGQVLLPVTSKLEPDVVSSYNLREDKEASYIVFNNLQKNEVTFVCIGKYAAYQLPISKDFFEEWSLSNRTPINLLAYVRKTLYSMWRRAPDLVYQIYKVPDEFRHEQKWFNWLSNISYPYDPLLVISLVKPDLFQMVAVTLGQQKHFLIGNDSANAGICSHEQIMQILKESVSNGSKIR